ncbi:hypothetical protein SprV_0100113300 [Sparganum proliferum]
MWGQGVVPQNFKDATIVHLHKRKGNCQLCDNHRGISLLNIARKILARILLNRLNHYRKQGLPPESQCGVRHGASAPVDAYRDERPGIRVAYRADGQLLNHRRMHFQSHVSATSIHELLFANDCAPNNTSNGDMQRGMDLFAIARQNFGLIFNMEKTVVMHQPPPDAVYVAPQINVNGARLQAVDNFAYLGSTLFRNITIDNEVARLISMINQAFSRLRNTV